MDKCTHACTHAHTHHRNVDSPLEYLGWLMVSLFSSQAGLNYRLAEYLNFAGTAILQFEWWGSLQPNFLCSHFILFNGQQMWWCQSVRLSHASFNHQVMHTEDVRIWNDLKRPLSKPPQLLNHWLHVASQAGCTQASLGADWWQKSPDLPL